MRLPSKEQIREYWPHVFLVLALVNFWLPIAWVLATLIFFSLIPVSLLNDLHVREVPDWFWLSIFGVLTCIYVGWTGFWLTRISRRKLDFLSKSRSSWRWVLIPVALSQMLTLVGPREQAISFKESKPVHGAQVTLTRERDHIILPAIGLSWILGKGFGALDMSTAGEAFSVDQNRSTVLLSRCSGKNLPKIGQQIFLRSAGRTIASLEAPKWKEGKYWLLRVNSHGIALTERVITGFKSLECQEVR